MMMSCAQLRLLVLLLMQDGAFAFIPSSVISARVSGNPASKSLFWMTPKPRPDHDEDTRRNFLISSGSGMMMWPFVSGAGSNGNQKKATAAETANAFDTDAITSAAPSVTDPNLLADLPMIRLRLPRNALGREYVALQLKIGDQGPFDFMVDSGLTTEMMTPHLRQILGLSGGGNGDRVRGLAAGGATSNAIQELRDVSLCCGSFFEGGRSELKLPPLHAVITDFPQEHIDPAHDPVEGMLGMEMLSMFDVDLDFAAKRIRFYKPGTAAAVAAKDDLVEIPAVVINETGLLGIRLTVVPSSPSQQQRQQQPVLGFLDCGSTFTAMNWAAAAALGLPSRPDDPAYRNGPTVAAVGIDGRPMQLPTTLQRFSFAGNSRQDPSTGRLVGFEQPPARFTPWDAARVAVGDLPVFAQALGDGVRPYAGPAVLIGLDILAQRRIILGTSDSRQRRVFVSPK